MAFIDIKDPKERDKIVADYLSTIKHVQEQNEDERAVGQRNRLILKQHLILSLKLQKNLQKLLQKK